MYPPRNMPFTLTLLVNTQTKSAFMGYTKSYIYGTTAVMLYGSKITFTNEWSWTFLNFEPMVQLKLTKSPYKEPVKGQNALGKWIVKEVELH